MCSISGRVVKYHSKEYNKKLVENIDDNLDLLSHRGTDSFGCTLISSKKVTNIRHIKKKIFLKGLEEELNTNKYDYVLVHARWKSIGGLTLDLQHPIATENDKSGVVASVIHNGTNKKLYELLKTHGGSDTAVMSKIMSLYTRDSTDLVSIMLQGAGVVFSVFNTGQVYVHIDNTRPLFISENRNMISSEPHTQCKWFLIKEHDKLYDNIIDFMQNVETYAKGIVCAKKVHTRKCTNCQKTHIHNASWGKCMRCEVKEDNK